MGFLRFFKEGGQHLVIKLLKFLSSLVGNLRHLSNTDAEISTYPSMQYSTIQHGAVNFGVQPFMPNDWVCKVTVFLNMTSNLLKKLA